MAQPIYLDHNATTPLDPLVRAEMEPWLGPAFGNPSSLHTAGLAARQAIDAARAQVARLIGAQPDEMVFTSGGTEANNLAILGAVAAAPRRRPAVATSAIEHPAVLNPCRHLGERGGTVTVLPVDREGGLDAAAVWSAVPDGTLLVSVMAANNEIGTVQPVRELAGQAHARGVLVHTDAVQAVGRIPVDVDELGVDLLSLSGHKLQGPQGIGALYVRRGTRLSPLAFGGHQERGLRPGTENVAAIVGLGKACELAGERLPVDAPYVGGLRAAFEAGLLERVADVRVNGAGAPRLPNTSNVSFAGVAGEALVAYLDLRGVAVSTGAACHRGGTGPSHVLTAMGRTPAEARSAVRFSFGRGNRQQEATEAVALVALAIARLRQEPGGAAA
jgi:cysteine desulfurase